MARFKAELDRCCGLGPFRQELGPLVRDQFRQVLEDLEPLADGEPILAELLGRGALCAGGLQVGRIESVGELYAWFAEMMELIPAELVSQEDISGAFSDGWGEAAQTAIEDRRHDRLRSEPEP